MFVAEPNAILFSHDLFSPKVEVDLTPFWERNIPFKIQLSCLYSLTPPKAEEPNTPKPKQGLGLRATHGLNPMH